MTTTPEPSPPEPSLPFTIDPIAGGFTAGQTVTATFSGVPPAGFLVELLDEENKEPAMITTFRDLNPTKDGFDLVVPTLR